MLLAAGKLGSIEREAKRAADRVEGNVEDLREAQSRRDTRDTHDRAA
jgi:hypothetical protein